MSINYAREDSEQRRSQRTDRQLQRALERWQPAFLELVEASRGPEGDFQARRTSICARPTSVDAKGWATSLVMSRCPTIAGEFFSLTGNRIAPGQLRRPYGGARAWQDRCRANIRGVLRRLIVTQGDTEPASVEQQRLLGAYTCPVALRFAQPVPSQCRGRPPSLGHGLPAARLFRPRRPGRGRRVAGTPFRRS